MFLKSFVASKALINWRGECKTMLSDDLGEKKKKFRESA